MVHPSSSQFALLGFKRRRSVRDFISTSTSRRPVSILRSCDQSERLMITAFSRKIRTAKPLEQRFVNAHKLSPLYLYTEMGYWKYFAAITRARLRRTGLFQYIRRICSSATWNLTRHECLVDALAGSLFQRRTTAKVYCFGRSRLAWVLFIPTRTHCTQSSTPPVCK